MLSTPTKYAIVALQELAEYEADEFVSVQQLAEEADVPAPYLAKLMKTLGSKGLIETKKGLGGGVRLPQGPKKLRFVEICEALDDPIVAKTCLLSKEKCCPDNPCPHHESWSKLRMKVLKFLESSTIG